MRHDAIVIGAGISGLTAAFELMRAGKDPLLLEASSQVGGLICSESQDGYLLEHGPNTVRATAPLIDLCQAVGLGDRILRASAVSKRRYVRRDGRLHALPSGPGELLRSRLWSLRGKLSLLAEPLRGGRSPEGESVTDFFVRRLGRELFDYAVEPFVGGSFAGDPDRLEMRSAFRQLLAWESDHGSLIRGGLRARKQAKGAAVRGLFSFPDGLAELPLAIAARLGDRVCCDRAVDAVWPEGDHWVVEGGGQSWSTASVLLAVGARQSAQMIRSWAPEAADRLGGMEAAGVAVVHLGIPLGQFEQPPDGFGFLNPRREKHRVLGVVCASNCFPGRAPEGHLLATAFIGGDRQPELLLRSDAELVSMTLEEEFEPFGLSGPPSLSRVIRYQAAIPQYRTGQAALEADLDALEAAHPGLGLAGAFRGGISVPDCVHNAQIQAARLVGISPVN